MNTPGVPQEVERLGWMAIVPGLAVVAVAVAGMAYDIAWLRSPCVDWETGYDSATGQVDVHPGCREHELTTESHAQAVAFTVGATTALLVAGGIASFGLSQRRAAWFWTGLGLLAVASIPVLYARLFFGADSHLGSMRSYLGEPWHAGFGTVPLFFLAARASDAFAPRPAFSVLVMRTVAVLLLVAEALWFLFVAGVEGDFRDWFRGGIPVLAWVLLLTPPTTAVAAFWRFGPPERAEAAPAS